MKEKIELDNIKYKVIENYKDAFSLDEIRERYTDYFYEFDYILGDYAYGKLRLKGFYDSSNSKCKNLNDFKNIKSYIKNNCAYDCKYFILQKEQ